MIKLIFAILAIIAFFLAGFNVTTPRISWRDIGFAFTAMAIFLPL